jgi:hypothetical protein
MREDALAHDELAQTRRMIARADDVLVRARRDWRLPAEDRAVLRATCSRLGSVLAAVEASERARAGA